MSLHYTPMIVTAKATHQCADCGTGGVDSTSGGIFNGSVVDRLGLGVTFTHAQPFMVAQLPGTTSTQGQRYRSIGVRLRHGDSSGGGDLADFTPMPVPAVTPFYTTQGESTDWKNWTTGLTRMQTSHMAYPLLGAKRFITAAGVINGPGLTTATAAANLVTAALGLSLIRSGVEAPGEISLAVGGDRGVLGTTATSTV